MALSYFTDQLILTDDNDPSRQPVIVPLPADQATIDAAILAYYGPPVLPPDWATFKRTCLADPAVNQVLAAAQTAAPAAALALPAALMSIAQGGDIADFRAAWQLLQQLNLAPAALAQQLLALAESCHLPDEFKAIL
jgi:hypothetical protein